ncbi:MAG TPA: hypothetical protein VFA20_04025 [Myxococcaceae bacterium]|nr:hypothetical protein [Myxococcaceae bacterium]
MRRILLGLAAAGLALSCSHFQSTKDRTLCPESRDQVCLTVPDCTMDEARGCRVCQCSAATPTGTRPEDYGQPSTPRDRNQPP